MSLVAILDADKEGFLRSTRSLIQTIGRAARNVAGKVILYADKQTDSIKHAVAETRRRRELQTQHNLRHGITPRTTTRSILDIQVAAPLAKKGRSPALAAVDLKQIDDIDTLRAAIDKLRKAMKGAADDLDFELAATLRDEARKLEQLELQLR